MEYEKWVYVRSDTAASALQFFGEPPDWPVELDAERTLQRGQKVWRILSRAWLAQQRGPKK